MADEFDLVVIGAGSGGVATARRARALGARVAICEARDVGGTCVMRGCVPKKLLVLASRYHEEFEDARRFGYALPEPRLDFAGLMALKDAEIARLSRLYERFLSESGVELVRGIARLTGPNEVDVAGSRLRAHHIVVATGSRPDVPRLPGIEHAITSDEALSLPAIPRHLIVVGGGYVGVELAGMYRSFGSHVELVVREKHVLGGFDGSLRNALQEAMTARGIVIHNERTATALTRTETGLRLRLDRGELEGDVVLFATGRVPHTADLGLSPLGVNVTARGAVVVDAYSRSSVPTIHAVGDVTDRINLTPVALAEGRALADSLFGPVPKATSHELVPSAVFSQPPLSFVGLGEEKARQKGHKVSCYLKSFRPLKNGITDRPERTTMKVVVDSATDRVLGMHMVGTDAPEIIQGFAAALKAGLTKTQLDDTVGIHPTAAEEFVSMRTAHCSPYDP